MLLARCNRFLSRAVDLPIHGRVMIRLDVEVAPSLGVCLSVETAPPIPLISRIWAQKRVFSNRKVWLPSAGVNVSFDAAPRLEKFNTFD
jgi:hypothetical protein